MATLFPVDTFTGLRPDGRPAGRLRSGSGPGPVPQGTEAPGRRSGDVPELPGVYGMLGRHGDLIYVGKAKSLRARLMSYFRDSRDPKAGRILQHTHTLVWETVPTSSPPWSGSWS